MKENRNIFVILVAALMLLGGISLSMVLDNSLNKEAENSNKLIKDYGNVPKYSSIPSGYNPNLNLTKNYIYNVSQWSGYNNWTLYNGTNLGAAKSNNGGQIIFNFSQFGEAHPNDNNDIHYVGSGFWWDPSDQVPYINVTLKEKVSPSFSTNSTFLNVTNSNVAHILGLGYNRFRSGFIIPVDDLNNLKDKARAQNETDWEAEILAKEYTEYVKFQFCQQSGAQNITLIYNKTSGLLVQAQVERIGMPSDFLLYLDGYSDIELLEYSNKIDLDSPYIYNITAFGNPIKWKNIDNTPTGQNVHSNNGGQISINFTGLYGREVEDINSFEDPIPYYDIKIFNKTDSGLILNFTRNNISNGESALNLLLGYKDFASGFLIPYTDYSQIKVQALDASTDAEIRLEIEETANCMRYTFKNVSGGQNTSLIYERRTGLLVWAKTIYLGNFLEIKSLNFTLDLNIQWNYTVNKFGKVAQWWGSDWSYRGHWYSNGEPNYGKITANFTGYYIDPFHSWAGTQVWLAFESFYKEPYNYYSTLALNNISNSEASEAMILGWNYFQYGFLLKDIEKITNVKEFATQEATSSSRDYPIYGTLEIKETDLSITLTFNQDNSAQYTSVRYEKFTGLLLWSHSTYADYELEMKIEGLVDFEKDSEIKNTPDNEEEKTDGENNEGEKDEEENDQIREISIPSFSLFAFILLAILTISVQRVSKKIRANK